MTDLMLFNTKTKQHIGTIPENAVLKREDYTLYADTLTFDLIHIDVQDHGSDRAKQVAAWIDDARKKLADRHEILKKYHVILQAVHKYGTLRLNHHKAFVVSHPGLRTLYDKGLRNVELDSFCGCLHYKCAWSASLSSRLFFGIEDDLTWVYDGMESELDSIAALVAHIESLRNQE